MPKISVIVPVYKVEAYLSRCVDSLFAQTYMDFELILVDDGSPDGCPAMCDDYAEKDNRVKVIHKKNGGLSDARNAGIDWVFAHSDSEWITFIDSDDWVHPEYLEKLYTMVIDEDVTISVCGFEYTSGEQKEYEEKNWHTKLLHPEDFFIQNNTNATVAWGKLYKKDCFDSVRYPVGKIHEDEYTTYRILFSKECIAVTDAPLYYYFTNHLGIIHTRRGFQRTYVIQPLEEQLSYFRKNHFQRAYAFQINNVLCALVKAYEELQAEEKSKESVRAFRIVRFKIRRFLVEHRFGIQQHREMYEKVFPRMTRLYDWVRKN